VTAPIDDKQHNDSGIGCVVIALAINGLLMGLAALSFARGAYSSAGQELWYRYGSIAFFTTGFVLPAVVVFYRRSTSVLLITLSWLFANLIAFVAYVGLSSGGM